MCRVGKALEEFWYVFGMVLGMLWDNLGMFQVDFWIFSGVELG